LLRAIVDRSRPAKACWRPARSGPVVDWGRRGEPRTCPDSEAIDLTRIPGLRIWCRADSARTEITFLFHHACCDGIGAMRFIGDVLATYGTLTADAGRQPVLEPIEPTSIAQRWRVAVKTPEPISRLQAIRATLKETLRWLTRHPTPLASPRRPPQASENAPFPRIRRYTFSVDDSVRLRRWATSQSATLNDLLLRDMFLAIVEWNRRQRPGDPQRWIRINMPTSMRDRSHDPMPAANLMSYAFLTRRPSACRDPQELLRGISWETGVVKRWNLGHFFLAGVSFVFRSPLLTWLAFGWNRCFATVVLTNMGEASRRLGARFPRDAGRLCVGNLRMDEVYGVPPIRRKTHAGFAITMYAGRLTVSLRWDPAKFDTLGADELLNCYVDRLKESLRQADPAAPAHNRPQAR
jgi:hypothetical protein